MFGCSGRQFDRTTRIKGFSHALNPVVLPPFSRQTPMEEYIYSSYDKLDGLTKMLDDRKRSSLFFLSILILNLLTFTSFGSIPGALGASNDWYVGFDWGIKTYTLPRGTFNINGKFIDLGSGNGAVFLDGSDYCYGSFNPYQNIQNFSLSIRFKNFLYTNADPTQYLFRWFYQHFTNVINLLVIGIQDANTANPLLIMYISNGITLTDASGRGAEQIAGKITHGQWHTLVITFNIVEKRLTSFLDGGYWAGTNLTIPAGSNYLWPALNSSGYTYYLNVGALNVLGTYSVGYYRGDIDYIQYHSAWTSGYMITQTVLWYKYDESPVFTAMDYSGNNYHASIDSATQVYSEGKYGYCIGGAETTGNSMAVYLSSTGMPAITDKYSFGMWVKYETGTASWPSFLVWLKPFKIATSFTNANPRKIQWTLYSTIGGSERSLATPIPTSASGIYASNWIYLYGKYDGSNLRFSVVIDNGTVFYNSSTSCTGVITSYGNQYSSTQAYGFNNYGASGAHLPIKLDEFKLSKQIWGPYELNGTGFGTPANVTQLVTPTTEGGYFSARVIPSTMSLYNSSSANYGQANLVVNASGSWALRLSSRSTSLLSSFYLTGVSANLWTAPSATFTVPITVKAKTNCSYGTYQFFLNISSYDITFQIQYGRPWAEWLLTVTYQAYYDYVPTLTFNVTISNSPLTLRWDDIPAGYINATITPIGSVVTCGITNYDMTPSDSRAMSYIDIFRSSCYYTETRNGYGRQVLQVRYVVDKRLIPYVKNVGNFSIYATIKIYNLNNPSEAIYSHVVINVKVRKTILDVYGANKLWVVLDPDSLNGVKTNEIHAITARIYSNTYARIHWSVGQNPVSSDPAFTQITGDLNDQYANYSTTLLVKVPALAGSYVVHIVIYDFLNPLFTNQTDLTIETIPTGATFAFALTPSSQTITQVGTYAIFRGLITDNNGQSHPFDLHGRNNYTAFSISVNNIAGGAKNLWSLGTDSKIAFFVYITLNQAVPNNTYQFEFVAYRDDNASNAVSQTVSIIVVLPKGTVIPTPTPTPTPGNMTTITTNYGVNVYGPGSGPFNWFILFIANWSGLNFDIIAFGIGIAILIIIEVITAIASRGQLAAAFYIMLAIPLTILNIMIGLWSGMILVAMLIFGALLLSMKVGGKFVGRQETVEGSNQ